MSPLLNDPGIPPSDYLLEAVLGTSYPAYLHLSSLLVSEEYDCSLEWNYYKDGKSWLCKISRKKKTVCWLSAWENYFRTVFYFTGKNAAEIMALPLNEQIREDFRNHKPVGKLLPLMIEIRDPANLTDVLKVVDYKIHQK